jgi:hypothetical protein
MRRTASHAPTSAPCDRTASRAYSEQLGENRHAGGSVGRTTTWYTRISAAQPRATAPGRSRAEAERSRELCCRCGMADVSCAGFRDDDNVRRWRHAAPCRSHHLANETLHPVADHGIADARADRNADPRRAIPSCSSQHDEVVCVIAPGITLHTQVIHALAQPRALREARRPARRHPGCLGGTEAVRRLRPLARRRLRTFRPPGVAMRARNPCVRLRRRLLG